mmetsp:Transcript_26623/g.62534  ORF Transcript_26623/g.62534 Transcript_26623/m.62534 type:complete len:95 (-) Transcript_26623:54-338(-)
MPRPIPRLAPVTTATRPAPEDGIAIRRDRASDVVAGNDRHAGADIATNRTTTAMRRRCRHRGNLLSIPRAIASEKLFAPRMIHHNNKSESKTES